MSSLDEFSRLERLRRATPSPYAPLEVPPTGWRPGVELDGDRGTITSRPSDSASPQWDVLLRSWGFDPADYEVVEPVRVSTWDAHAKDLHTGEIVTKQLWSHRAQIVRKAKDRADLESLIAQMRSRRPVKRTPSEGPGTFAFMLSDPQIGKSEGGGTAATVERMSSVADQAIERYKSLARLGLVGSVAILNGGDTCENTCGWYPAQLNSIDLNRRDQMKVARRILRDIIAGFSDIPNVEAVTYVATLSNHGENRQGGKAVTGDADNLDLELAENLHDIFAVNPARYSHVRFVVPDGQPVTMVDLGGVPVALSHGHKASNGDTAARKQREWWKGQALGGLDAAAAKVLVTGHYHHAAMVTDYGRTWFQLQALDGGSDWLTQRTGQHSPPGALSLVFDANVNIGWRDERWLWV